MNWPKFSEKCTNYPNPYESKAELRLQPFIEFFKMAEALTPLAEFIFLCAQH